MHPELGPIAVLSSLSLLLPLPWHWRARNIATLAIIGWLFTSNLIYAVDAFIWIDNVDIVAPVWCDISLCFSIPNLCRKLTIFFSYKTYSRCKFCFASGMSLHLYSSWTSGINTFDAGDLRGEETASMVRSCHVLWSSYHLYGVACVDLLLEFSTYSNSPQTTLSKDIVTTSSRDTAAVRLHTTPFPPFW